MSSFYPIPDIQSISLKMHFVNFALRLCFQDCFSLFFNLSQDSKRSLQSAGTPYDRWFDLRRSTRPRLEKVLDGTRYVLEENDARYTLAIPKEAIEANPGLLN